MHTTKPARGTITLGSVLFLMLALLLAIFSGDTLLVLAVASAIGGLLLLTSQRQRQAVQRPTAIPLQDEMQTMAPAQVVVRRPAPVRAQRAMAVRRYRASSLPGRRTSSGKQTGRATDSRVTEPSGQPQIIQVLQ